MKRKVQDVTDRCRMGVLNLDGSQSSERKYAQDSQVPLVGDGLPEERQAIDGYGWLWRLAELV